MYLKYQQYGVTQGYAWAF